MKNMCPRAEGIAFLLDAHFQRADISDPHTNYAIWVIREELSAWLWLGTGGLSLDRIQFSTPHQDHTSCFSFQGRKFFHVQTLVGDNTPRNKEFKGGILKTIQRELILRSE